MHFRIAVITFVIPKFSTDRRSWDGACCAGPADNNWFAFHSSWSFTEDTYPDDLPEYTHQLILSVSHTHKETHSLSLSV